MSPEQEKENDVLLGMMDNALRKLSEHFDAVQIFASKHIGNDTGTARFAKGAGNWFARYGQVKVWMETCHAETFKEANGPEDDE